MKKRVIILCTGNSARSQMAEALINHRMGDTWEAVSAGTNPADRPNPYALRALAEIDIHTEGSKPSHVNEFKDETFDLVVTVCDDANENCPLWLGEGERVHIGFPDPAAVTGTDEEILEAFRIVRNNIEKDVLRMIETRT